jgi:hypothetical protein
MKNQFILFIGILFSNYMCYYCFFQIKFLYEKFNIYNNIFNNIYLIVNLVFSSVFLLIFELISTYILFYIIFKKNISNIVDKQIF